MSKSIDDLSDEVAAVAKDVAVIKAQLEMTPKQDPVKCANHQNQIGDHEMRISDVENLIEEVDLKQMWKDVRDLKKTAGRENALRILLGMVGVGFFFAMKWIWAGLLELVRRAG